MTTPKRSNRIGADWTLRYSLDAAVIRAQRKLSLRFATVDN